MHKIENNIGNSICSDRVIITLVIVASTLCICKVENRVTLDLEKLYDMHDANYTSRQLRKVDVF